jgi:adenylylsulfate kinase
MNLRKIDMKILVCGLPGAGKTTLATQMATILPNCVHLNGDRVRELFDDWDFTAAGRARQALRMNTLAGDLLAGNTVEHVIADFVAPTRELRNIYDADIVIWVDTIDVGRFEDTNKMWEPLRELEYDFRVIEHLTENQVIDLCNLIQEPTLD